MCVMNRRERDDIPQKRDRHLDVPAEANRDKHINYLEDDDERREDAANDKDSPFYVPNNAPLKDKVEREKDRT